MSKDKVLAVVGDNPGVPYHEALEMTGLDNIEFRYVVRELIGYGYLALSNDNSLYPVYVYVSDTAHRVHLYALSQKQLSVSEMASDLHRTTSEIEAALLECYLRGLLDYKIEGDVVTVNLGFRTDASVSSIERRMHRDYYIPYLSATALRILEATRSYGCDPQGLSLATGMELRFVRQGLFELYENGVLHNG